MLLFVAPSDQDEKKVLQKSWKKKSGAKMALVLYGVRFEALFTTGASIRRFIVDELNADLFIYGWQAHAHYNVTGAVKQVFGDRVKAVFFGPQPSAKDIAAMVASSPKRAELLKVCGTSNFVKSGTLNGYLWMENAYNLMKSYEDVHDVRYDYVG